MPKFIHKFYLLVLIFIIAQGCATKHVQYAENVTTDEKIHTFSQAEISHTFYLIGDAGNAKMGQELNHFKILKNELSNASKNATVLFLGDNIYEKGMPSKKSKERPLAEHRMDVQINLVEQFKGNTVFIPGNHDYYTNGIVGLKREQEYVIKKLKNKEAFLPKNGCPIDKFEISEEVSLILIDTQWYLENWDKNPTMNDDCSIKTREQFFSEYERLIKKNTNKTTVVALHHPMFSNGPHGGQFSMKAQLYPINNSFPLPILGSIINFLRKTTGLSTQDLMNPIYRELSTRLLTLTQKFENIIFVSGHEHNLQYIKENNLNQIISGSGSKTSAARVLGGSQFSYGGLGYAKLVTYKNGASEVYFYGTTNNENQLLFRSKIIAEKKLPSNFQYDSILPNHVKSSVYSDKEVERSKSFKNFWGKHYRKYYNKPIIAKTVQLDTLFGGLTPIRKGGGNQSRSLRLINKNGQEFVMRALHKSATQYLQAVAFKNQYVHNYYDDTYTEGLLLDVYTTAHPYAPLTVGELADAANIYHSNPKLFYVPKQKTLKHFNSNFGDELYFIEERATSGHNIKSFGFSNTLISTTDFLSNLRKSDNFMVDEPTYIRARLFDMLIGDWDRHEDQWRWAAFKNGKKTIYKPVPRDRDQAFSSYDGFIFSIITRLIYDIKSMQTYDKNIRNVKTFNLAPHRLDVALINKSDFKEWEKQVKLLQKNITDEVIKKAFTQMPLEMQDETVVEIKHKLKGRLKNLHKIAKEYYKHLQKYPIVKGDDKDNWFEIIRLPNGNTSIQIFNIKNKEKGTKIFDQTYSKSTSNEIWVYGLDDTDVFQVTGNSESYIPIKIIGGQNNDIYNIQNGKKITIYDFKSKKNTFKTDFGKIKLVDNYDLNFYDYKKIKHNRNLIIPALGINPDDGFKLGVNYVFTVYGYERNPFTQQHTINAAYYFANSGYSILYNAEFANIFHKWNFLLESKFTSPNYTQNFYGYGNDTKNFEDVFSEDYHRVRLSTYSVAPNFTWKGRLGASFKLGAMFESLQIEKTAGRFINDQPISIKKRNNYLGVQGSYLYENYNDVTFPTLGMFAELQVGWKANINEDIKENNGYITPSIGFNYNLSSNGKVVLATKLKSNIIIGNTFKFYNAASIGGKDGLRGYNNNRFTGNTSYYQNTDLRFNLTNIKTRLVPFQIGVFGGFDYGRVWHREESSNSWKTSYGVGLWIDTARLLSLNLSVFTAKEGPYIRFGLGYDF